jgi:hypothetical protein
MISVVFVIHVKCAFGVSTPRRKRGGYDLLGLGRYHACITALTFGMVPHGVLSAFDLFWIYPREEAGSLKRNYHDEKYKNNSSLLKQLSRCSNRVVPLEKVGRWEQIDSADLLPREQKTPTLSSGQLQVLVRTVKSVLR